MTNHDHADSGTQPPAAGGARQSRTKLPAALRALSLAAPLLLVLTLAGAASAGARLSAQAPNKSDQFFAGYRVGDPATSVSARFIIPKLACPASGRLAIRPGVELITNKFLVEAGVLLRCQHGAPVFAASVIVNNTVGKLPVTVNPGDKIAVSVTQTAAANAASIADVTQGSSVTVRTNTGAKNLVAQVGVATVVARPGGLELGVPPFKTITFRAAKVGGSAIGASNPTAVNRALFGTLQILTGPLNSAGTSFTTTFKHT